MAAKSRSQSGLLTWLTETVQPVFMIDQRKRVRFFNRGCVELTGCQPGDMIGKSCHYALDPMASLNERILQAIAPPPEVYAGQQLLTTLQFIDAHGQQQQHQVLYLPLKNSEELPVIAGIILLVPAPPRLLQPTYAQNLHRELALLLTEQAIRYQPSTLIARSAPMQRVAEQLKLARNSSLPVHFTGKPGTGKEYLARLLHQQSRGPLEPLPVLQCRLLPRSEQRRILKDLQSQASHHPEAVGLLLKDVDHLAEDLQEKMADLFQQHQWPKSLQLFSTSSRNLTKLAEAGQFSSRLMYALTPLTIQVPGLEERIQDLELLTQFFVEQKNRERERQLTGVDQQAMDCLRAYHWQRHVAELEQMLSEAIERCQGNLLQAEHLPFRWQTGQQAQSSLPPQQPRFEPLEQKLEQLERSEILRALEHARQNKAKAAELLGMTRPKLYRRLEQLGLLAADDTPEN